MLTEEKIFPCQTVFNSCDEVSRSIFPASIIEIGSKKGLKKREKEFHIEKVNEGLNDSTPAKKRKSTEDKKMKKGKRK